MRTTICRMPVASMVFPALAVMLAVPLAGVATGQETAAARSNAWTLAAPVAGINTPGNDGCPIESRNGLSLYIASNRPGTLGGNDIWVADRLTKNSPWSAPQNLGAPVNTEFNDFCPTPIQGNWLFFVSEKPGSDTCASGPGIGDMYLTRHNRRTGWAEPVHLGCAELGEGPNTVSAEFSPSFVETAEGTFLFYSSGIQGSQDIYMSRMRHDGSFEPGVRVDELSTGFDDRMPNVSKDGLEIVFSSNRTDLGGFGSQDVYIAKRACTEDPWSAPVNAGSNVNTAGSETRATLSGDFKRLYFGRDGDVYMSTRARR
jgi:Tol biopolymer transport system component